MLRFQGNKSADHDWHVVCTTILISNPDVITVKISPLYHILPTNCRKTRLNTKVKDEGSRILPLKWR